MFSVASAAGGFGPGTGPIWFTDVDCSSLIGNGLSALCLLNSFIGMTDNCFHDNDAGVLCTSAIGKYIKKIDIISFVQSFNKIIFIGAPCDLVVDGFGYSGRLQVCGFKGSPASVCANSFEDFNDAAATVACASIGHKGTGCEMMTYKKGFNQCNIIFIIIDATSLGYFGQGSGAIQYSKVICDGTETLLEDCETELHDINSCNHNQDVGIVCYGKC